MKISNNIILYYFGLILGPVPLPKIGLLAALFILLTKSEYIRT